MKNVFYFILKALLILKIFKIFSWLFGHAEKRPVKKVKVNYKIYAKQMITIHKLSNISRSKGNQTMTFGQLIEYNMRNIFQDKSYTKCVRAASPRPFNKE